MIRTMLGVVVCVLVLTAGLGVGLAGAGADKVTICHKPDNQSIELSVGDPAVQAHLDHGDTVGPCGGGETTPTETTPTDTTPPPPPPPPPPTGTGSNGDNGGVSVYCDFDHYVVVGVVDGEVADSATPATIPGTYKGWTNVTLHRGDTDFRTAVYTYGDCIPKVG